MITKLIITKALNNKGLTSQATVTSVLTGKFSGSPEAGTLHATVMIQEVIIHSSQNGFNQALMFFLVLFHKTRLQIKPDK